VSRVGVNVVLTSCDAPAAATLQVAGASSEAHRLGSLAQEPPSPHLRQLEVSKYPTTVRYAPLRTLTQSVRLSPVAYPNTPQTSQGLPDPTSPASTLKSSLRRLANPPATLGLERTSGLDNTASSSSHSYILTQKQRGLEILWSLQHPQPLQGLFPRLRHRTRSIRSLRRIR
jgi:hypothetical protein